MRCAHNLAKEENHLKCGICGLEVKEQVTLDEHKSMHSNRPALECVLCYRHFKEKSGLARHMRIHVSKVATFEILLTEKFQTKKPTAC